MFRDRLAQEMRKADRGATFVALLYIDLDHFKEVNDRLGHAAGDALLVDAGCDYAQGYMFGHPMTAAELEALALRVAVR